MMVVAAKQNALELVVLAGVPEEGSWEVMMSVAGPPCTAASGVYVLVVEDRDIGGLVEASRGGYSAGFECCTWPAAA